MAEQNPELVSLESIAAMSGKPQAELMERLPPPSLESVEGDVVCIWPISEVRGKLHEATNLGCWPRVAHGQRQYLWTTQSSLAQEWKRQRDALGYLRNTIERSRDTLRALRTEIEAAEDRLRVLDSAGKSLNESSMQATKALWPWQPPAATPKRMRGVYRLLRGDKTVYIGQSVNILSRVLDHSTERDFDQFSYALVKGGRLALNEVESALIIIERPLWNHGADGKLRHPTGHQWTREEAEAVLDKYRRGAGTPDKEAA